MMRKLLLSTGMATIISALAFGQSIPSPQLPCDVLPEVIYDYLGYVPGPSLVEIMKASSTGCVVTVWNVTNAIPTWANLTSATNVAAEQVRAQQSKASLTNWDFHLQAGFRGLTMALKQNGTNFFSLTTNQMFQAILTNANAEYRRLVP